MTTKRKKTALFGGKFDPPHLAHQMIIFLALEKYLMDEVWVIPSYSHPFGYKSSDFDHRLNMCKIMAGIWPEKRVKVLDSERKIGTKTVCTVDLIKYLLHNFPENDFSLLIGSDNWDVRSKWKNFDEIERLCKQIIVIGRGENSSLSFSLPNISSSMIKKIVRDGGDAEIFLPAGIFEYINKNLLYRD